MGKNMGRRKKKIVSKTSNQSDDKRIHTTLKKFNCSTLPGIDEVNMFKEDGTVIHFTNPKVTASPTSNTFTVSGQNETKKITEMPNVLNQLGIEGIQGLQAWAQQQGLTTPGAGVGAGPSAMPYMAGKTFDDIAEADDMD